MMMVARVERVEPVRVAGLMRAKRGEGGHKTRGVYPWTKGVGGGLGTGGYPYPWGGPCDPGVRGDKSTGPPPRAGGLCRASFA